MNDECDKTNLFLGKFNITGLPKKKKGDINVFVELEVKEDSILEVTASYQYNNKLYDKKLIIERPKEILSIMDQLRERYNRIELYENELDKNYKESIINLEEDLRNKKSKNKVNNDIIKLLSKNIIESIGNFLMNNDVVFSNLYISFVKYYFNKICEFYQDFNIKNLNELEILKPSIIKIFNKLEFSFIIFEIIEEFIDLDNIYSNFKELILNNYWDKLNTIIYDTKNTMKEKKSNHYDKILKELSEAKKIANVCKELVKKFVTYKSTIAEISKNDLDNIIAKIEVREEIIKVKQKNFLKKLFFAEDIEKFKKLYIKYSNNPFMDIDDLNELGKIIGLDEGHKVTQPKNFGENFDNFFEKATKFMQWIGSKDYKEKNTEVIFTTIHKILEEYPYKSLAEEVKKMWDEYYEYKSQQNQPEKVEAYLKKIKGDYYELFNTEGLNDVELQVYEKILQYINKIYSIHSNI